MNIDSNALEIALTMFLLAGMFEARIKLGKLKACFDSHIDSNTSKKTCI